MPHLAISGMIRSPMMARWITIAAGIAVGLLCAALAAVPAVRGLEQRVGLQWLFDLRGPVEPPDVAVLVLMNERSAAAISLPRDPERFHRCEDLRLGTVPTTHVSLPALPSRWPRCIHARLLERLAEARARLVVFDVLFRERPPLPGPGGDLHAWQDEVFAKALSEKRVLVAQKVEERDGHEELANLSPSIAYGVLGAAPFPLVAEPNRRFDRFLAFKEDGLVTPTLPAVALQAYLTDGFPLLREFLVSHAGENADLLPGSAADLESRGQLQVTTLLIRELAHSEPDVPSKLRETASSLDWSSESKTETSAFRTLGALYGGDGTRLLNPYGHAGTFASVGYDDALAAPARENSVRFGGKAVFVGFGEIGRTEQVEHFSTVFSRGDGADLSGVEIAATAFSNLLEDRTLRELPLRDWLGLSFLAGFFAFVVCHGLGNRVAIAVVTVLAGVYLACAATLFSGSAIWMPIVLPLAVSTPLAALTAFGWKFWSAHRQRARLRDAFSHFVPKEVVAKLERNVSALHDEHESVECACVATDAANFTPLAEAMRPEQLAGFLNHYYESLFGRVAERGGFVSDVVGDAMLAIWPDRSPDTRRSVLHALLEMLEAVERFNSRLAGNRLNTRFGVDWGRVALTTVGSHVHYEYRAVGDAVNTAHRIQELNKRLGTRILVSELVIANSDGEFLSRNLGRFLLRGKSNSVRVHELIGLRAKAAVTDLERCATSNDAVVRLERGDVEGARELLDRARQNWPEDAAVAFLVASLAGANGIDRQDGAWVVN
jgi:adenylate cyclase